MSAHARLRSDLITSRQVIGGVQRIVVKDQLTGRFFRFKEHEFFIAEQLDGATGAEEVRQRVETKFGAKLGEQTLARFMERLHGIGLLDGDAATATPAIANGRKTFVRGNLLYLRLAAINPDRLFNWLIPKTRFLFTSAFIAISVALIATGLAVSLASKGEILRYFWGINRAETLILAWVTMIGVTVLHEFAHGLTCKHFGGKVQELGFLLIYFQPALYCNVSDAWLFPERAKRLWVTFAGAYFDLIAWALSAIVWRVTDPTTLPSYLAFVIMITSAVKIFFNMNPLIKLDGYYLLSDFLEVPNLRSRSFNYLSALIRRLGGERTPVLAETSSRERLIYVVYGLLACSYSFWLLSLVSWAFFHFLVNRYQAWGFTFFTIMFLAFFSGPIRRGFGHFSFRKGIASGAISSRMQRWLKILALLGLMLVVGVLCRMELKISGEFTIRPAHKTELRAEGHGVIQEIYFDEGQQVQKGDPVVQLSERDWRSELQKTEAEIDQKRAKLGSLRAGPRPEEIEVARTAVENARQRLQFAKRKFDRISKMLTSGLESRNAFDDAEEQFSMRQNELSQAESALKVLTTGTSVEDTTVQAELNRLRIQRDYIQDQIGLLRLVSPITGIVTTPKLKEKVGQYVEKGLVIAEVQELNTMNAEIAVPEKEISDVHRGQKVLLKFRAYPGRNFESAVVSIAPIVTKPADASKSAQAYEQGTVLVTTQLQNPELLLRPDMTGNAKICCGKHRLIDLTTRRLVRYLRVEFWSWW